ncbi:nitroreductase [Sulfitobacter sp. M57]|uniref:nitroreductase n=1 Tax=unclassified Sulfitobacter TaxID=196795 RepID=UPI0023E2E389|nr:MULTISPECIES: nitroreductase [unclassified Sulfitobacter]MDF3414354.1 nitroreductase [Sulfitobacter sp. KE5]MDF3420364.1 nitroreductase [Sulfitobacter sp. KE43]MDF3432900.1 nitroreductase [Sulfitobacter sp. KE42]MDF3458540.1 nitroreductase [Sulfitobacter sp. S74]MDF3462440.1 nitroreductase [Sulfitobacter sp. Ks18]
MTAYDTLNDTLKSRYSCRAFRPDPVPDSTITKIVEAARHVPSWCNAQPWQVTITKGNATQAFRTMLSDLAANGTLPAPDLAWPSDYTGAYADRRRTCGFQLYDAVGIEKSNRAGRTAQMMRNYALFDAPHVAIIHSPGELGPYGAMDSGGFVTAFTLAATALGVATIPQAAIAAYAPQVRDHLGIADDRLVLCAISFGYADPDHPANGFRTSRATAADIIDWKE